MTEDQTGVCYTYILECADGSFYTGWTTDLERRLQEHNRGQGARYTRSRLPVRLHYQEDHEDRSAAMQREHELKQLSHREKARINQQR